MLTTLEARQHELAGIVGPAHIATDEAACRGAAVDGITPKCVVSPQSAEQVAGVLKIAAETNLAVIPFRNATKLGMGNRPKRYDVALSLNALNNVWHYEPDDLTMTVEPGINLGDLQRLLARHRLSLPLDPPGGKNASLGGIVATNAAGPLRLYYGTPRDMVVGMKIATTDGKLVSTGGRVVKNVAGYDVSKLLIGSYGTLGVIVGINLKLFPLPEKRQTFVFRLPSLDSARELRRQITDSALTPIRIVYTGGGDGGKGILPVAFDGHEPALSEAKCAHATLWVEAAGSKRVIERYAGSLSEIARAVDATMDSVSEGDADRGWNWFSEFRANVVASSRDTVILRASLPISATEDYVGAVARECERAKVRTGFVVESGSGVVHFSLTGLVSEDAAVNLIGTLRHTALAQHGALVVEHCRAGLKDRIDAWGPPGSDFPIMRELKKAWDPNGIFSPGRFAGGL